MASTHVSTTRRETKVIIFIFMHEVRERARATQQRFVENTAK